MMSRIEWLRHHCLKKHVRELFNEDPRAVALCRSGNPIWPFSTYGYEVGLAGLSPNPRKWLFIVCRRNDMCLFDPERYMSLLPTSLFLVKHLNIYPILVKGYTDKMAEQIEATLQEFLEPHRFRRNIEEEILTGIHNANLIFEHMHERLSTRLLELLLHVNLLASIAKEESALTRRFGLYISTKKREKILA